MAKQKRNELLRVYIEGDRVYAKPKEHLNKRELQTLLGVLDEFMEFLTGKTRTGKGETKWLN